MTAQEFKQRYLPHHKALYVAAYKMTGNEQDAEDLLQDLYLKLWQKRDELPDAASGEPYLVRMIKNLFIEKSRIKRLDTSASVFDITEPPNDTDIETEMVQTEEAGVMNDMIEHLPDKEKKVVRMHIEEDRSYEEIQADTGLSPGNIRIIMMRARNKLKEQFKKRQKNETDRRI